MTENQIVNYVECAFINSLGRPIKKDKPIAIMIIPNEEHNQLSLVVVQKCYYPHPDAEGYCHLTVLEEDCVFSAKIGTPEYAVLELAKKAIDACGLFMK